MSSIVTIIKWLFSILLKTYEIQLCNYSNNVRSWFSFVLASTFEHFNKCLMIWFIKHFLSVYVCVWYHTQTRTGHYSKVIDRAIHLKCFQRINQFTTFFYFINHLDSQHYGENYEMLIRISHSFLNRSICIMMDHFFFFFFFFFLLPEPNLVMNCIDLFKVAFLSL